MTTAFKSTVAQLRKIIDRCSQDEEIQKIIKARDAVRGRYKALFLADNLPRLTEEDFRGFLNFNNNQHWTGLERQGGKICRDMGGLKRSLRILSEDEPIEARWNKASETPGLGRATLSAVLHILYPDICGIWNGTSEGALKMLRLWPEFSRGESGGDRYKKINDCLCQLAAGLDLDLWDLDAYMWGVKDLVGKDGFFCQNFDKNVLPHLDHLSPEKKERITEEYLRNAGEAKWIRDTYENCCQICGRAPLNGEFGDICEVHHICWLSRKGPDDRSNMMCLCPNHHAAIHLCDPHFNWEVLCFEFKASAPVKLKLNRHLKKKSLCLK